VPVAALLALRFDAVRSRVVGAVESALATTFRGRLRLDELERVDFRGVSVRGRVDDQKGRTVVRVDGLEVRVFWPALVVRALSGEEPLRIELDEVSVRHAEVRLIDDGSGVPR